MDLNNIHLPAAVVTSLYRSSLVDTGETITTPVSDAPATVSSIPVVEEQPSAPASRTTWKSLGDNNKKILVVVQSPDAVHLPDNELQFLTNMLTACKLSMADIVIVNIDQQPAIYKDLLPFFQSRICLLFNIEPAAFGLPMNFPFFQIQAFASCSFLYAPALAQLENDKVEKSKLWVSLRRLFNI